MVSDLNRIVELVKKFNFERDWDKFHNPKDVLIALVSEVGELAECYRWLKPEELQKIYSDPEKKKKIEDEIADVLINLIILSYKSDIDLLKAVENKLEKNKLKYPIEKVKGIHTNPIEGLKRVTSKQ